MKKSRKLSKVEAESFKRRFGLKGMLRAIIVHEAPAEIPRVNKGRRR